MCVCVHIYIYIMYIYIYIMCIYIYIYIYVSPEFRRNDLARELASAERGLGPGSPGSPGNKFWSVTPRR